MEPEKAPTVFAFLKISAETGTSVSSCVTCDSKSKSAWALDFDGQRAGQPVTLDGCFSADAPEQQIAPEVIKPLVDEFIASPRGVGCLLVYGQAEAGKESLMYGEAGARVNMTPRTLPAPGHAPQQKAPGLVLSAFRAALAALPQLAESGGPSEIHMGCVMLHMELLRDLLSPQSRVKISESQPDGVQLEGLHWQSITDVKEAEGCSSSPRRTRPYTRCRRTMASSMLATSSRRSRWRRARRRLQHPAAQDPLPCRVGRPAPSPPLGRART